MILMAAAVQRASPTENPSEREKKKGYDDQDQHLESQS